MDFNLFESEIWLKNNNRSNSQFCTYKLWKLNKQKPTIQGRKVFESIYNSASFEFCWNKERRSVSLLLQRICNDSDVRPNRLFICFIKRKSQQMMMWHYGNAYMSRDFWYYDNVMLEAWALSLESDIYNIVVYVNDAGSYLKMNYINKL